MPGVPAPPPADLVEKIGQLLGLEDAAPLVSEARRLYAERLNTRFSAIKVRDRIKRTNPFLLMIRGITTTDEWARRQIQSALFASEEEAVGHLLEAVAKACHPNALEPRVTDDLDYEVDLEGDVVEGYQVKLSWDCMPMSSRKNLSATIRRLQASYAEQDKEFIGHFAPCYGKATTTSPPGQAYVSLSSRDFWTRVGGGDRDFDRKVGQAVGLMCGEFRSRLEQDLIPTLTSRLTAAANPLIGQPDGAIDIEKLFRAVNR